MTVMFSDLVGWTALSARMDPEDLRELISAYQKCVAEAVHRFGGFVAQYLGDGVLVYFGYPEAHEDDAERAVRAGLELIAEVIALKTPASLQTRVGIATGLVVVGDLMTGSGQAHERGIVGETPNLAARLQGIAEPNTVVIAEATRRLLGNLFELKDLGARDLKGVAEPVCAWVALRASTVESRFEALHPSGLTALVGREEETELLLRRWSRTKSGEGQVVLISGEAGIGKSRLTAALLESLAPEPHTRLRYFCSPQHARIINRLAEHEASAMIDRIVGNKQLSANIRQDIIERTDGIPLFVEEMTKAVLEAESETAAERAIAAVPSPALAVPASLYASLMARLDRLGGPVKELAQIAAAIGREFSHALLASVVDQPEAALRSTLDRLIAAGLLFRRGVPPHATYLFKHALVQDAAYGTLLRARREALHARIAEAYERRFQDIVEAQPALLAHHLALAGFAERAIGFWLKAARKAIGDGAVAEAVAQLRQALALVGDLTEKAARQRYFGQRVDGAARLQCHRNRRGVSARPRTLHRGRGYETARSRALGPVHRRLRRRARTNVTGGRGGAFAIIRTAGGCRRPPIGPCERRRKSPAPRIVCRGAHTLRSRARGRGRPRARMGLSLRPIRKGGCAFLSEP